MSQFTIYFNRILMLNLFNLLAEGRGKVRANNDRCDDDDNSEPTESRKKSHSKTFSGHIIII